MPERVSLTGEKDPNARAKDDAEERLAAFMAGTFSDQYEALFDEMDAEQPSDPGNEFWHGWAQVMLAFMGIELLFMSQESAMNASEFSGIGVDWEFVIDQAENWSSTYAFNLVTNINENTRMSLQKYLQRYFAGEIDFEGLRGSLASRFSPVRADMIAITEVTRGFERGIDIYEDALNFFGLQTDRIWYTEDDGNVCEICEPNHGILRSEGWTASGVPPHPRCRCWTVLVKRNTAQRSIVVPDWPRKNMSLIHK